MRPLWQHEAKPLSWINRDDSHNPKMPGTTKKKMIKSMPGTAEVSASLDLLKRTKKSCGVKGKQSRAASLKWAKLLLLQSSLFSLGSSIFTGFCFGRNLQNAAQTPLATMPTTMPTKRMFMTTVSKSTADWSAERFCACAAAPVSLYECTQADKCFL